MGRDLEGAFGILGLVGVSTHAPAWGATIGHHGNKAFLKFQPTRPHGARQAPTRRTCVPILFQPTRPHGARREWCGRPEQGLHVSTHAPAWGATESDAVCGSETGVSTHAPAWGATANSQGSCGATVSVSTHAPAWGATQLATDKDGNVVFQPTRPHGARHILLIAGDIVPLVSTHAPAWGATHLRRDHLHRPCVSTHAPAWGATICRSKS